MRFPAIGRCAAAFYLLVFFLSCSPQFYPRDLPDRPNDTSGVQNVRIENYLKYWRKPDKKNIHFRRIPAVAANDSIVTGVDLIFSVSLAKSGRYQWIQEIYEYPQKKYRDFFDISNPFIDGHRIVTTGKLDQPPFYYNDSENKANDSPNLAIFRDRPATYHRNLEWRAQVSLVAITEINNTHHYARVASFNWGYTVTNEKVDTLPFCRTDSIWQKTKCILGSTDSNSMIRCIYD